MSHSPLAEPLGGTPRETSLVQQALAAVVLLAACVFVAYPTFGGQFTSYDDDRHITANPRMNPPALVNIPHYWKTPFLGLYIPVTYSAWTVIAAVASGPGADGFTEVLDPHVFHAANIALHVVCTLLVWRILARIVRRGWPAVTGALLFAVHPLQMEPIGWISGFRDLLGAAFALGAMLAHYNYMDCAEPAPAAGDTRRQDEDDGGIATVWRAVSIGLFVLAVLSKPTAAMMPFMLVVISWLLERRTFRRSITSALPMIVIGIGAMALARIVQPASTLAAVPVGYRPLVAADAVAFYVYKLFVPTHLSIDYGRTPQEVIASGWIWWTWVLPAGCAVVALLLRRRVPLMAAAMLVFVIGLLPVLGLTGFEFQRISTVADRYAYLSMLGAAMVLTKVTTRYSAIPIVVALALLGLLSGAQAETWRDGQTLYARAIRENPRSWIALAGLANADLDAGRWSDAEAKSRQLLDLKPPDLGLAYLPLGESLTRQGRVDEAVQAYEACANEYATDATPRISLVGLYLKQGKVDKALAMADEVLQRFPRHPMREQVESTREKILAAQKR